MAERAASTQTWTVGSGEVAGPEDRPLSLLHGSSWLVSARVFGAVGQLCAALALARTLSVHDRGIVAFVIAVSAVCAVLSSGGVVHATTVLAATRPRLRPHVLANQLVYAAVAGGAAGGLVAAVLGITGVGPAGLTPAMLAALAAAALAHALALGGGAFLMGCSCFRTQALLAPVTPWLYVAALGAAWATVGVSPTQAAALWAGAQLVGAALIVRAGIRETGLGRVRLPLLREALSFGGRAWIGSTAAFLSFRADQMLMGLIAAEATLGLYVVAVNGSEVLLYLPAAVAASLVPIAAATTEVRRTALVLEAFRAVSVLTFAGGLLLALIGPPLVPVLFGAEYEASVTPFLLLLPGALGFTALAVFSAALLARSSPGRSSIGSIVAMVVGLGLDAALIPTHGATGAAVAASASFLAGGAAAIVVYHRVAPFPLVELTPAPADLAAIRRALRRGRFGLAGSLMPRQR